VTATAQKALALDYASRLADLGAVTVHRYFAGASLRAGGKQFAFVMKGVLYLRTDALSEPSFRCEGARPFSYSGAFGPVVVSAYHEAPDRILEDDALLLVWARDALRAASASKASA